MSDLSVTIGADSKELSKGLAEASKEVKVFADSTDKAVSKSVGALNALPKASEKASSALGTVLPKAADKAADALTDFGKEAIKAGDAFEKRFQKPNYSLDPITKEVKKAKTEVIELAKAAKETETATKNIASGSAGASTSLSGLGANAKGASVGLGNIAQSAKPLVGELASVVGVSSDTVNSVKNLAETFISGGLALGVMSAAFLIFNAFQADSQQAAIENAQAVKEFSDTVDSLAESSSKEIAKLTILYDASQNLNIPLAERKKIVDELQAQYPTTFGNLKDETILAGKAKSAYDQLTQSLINAAVVRGGEDIIANKVKLLAKELIAFQLAQQKYSEQTKGKGFLSRNNTFVVDKNGDLEVLNDYETRIKKEIKETRDSIQGLLGNFSATDIIGQQELPKEKKTPKDKKDKDDKRKFIEIKKNYLDLSTQIGKEASKINGTNLIPFEKGLADIAARMPQYISPMVAVMERFNDDMSRIVEGGIGDTFAGIGDAIGNAFSEGTSLAQGLGQTLLSSLGSILGQLGQMAIATGVAILGIKLSLKTLNPVAAIAGGVALLALSGIVKGAAAKIGSGMGSGGSSGSPATGNLNQGSVNVGSSGSGFNGGTVVFEISGTKLLGVLQATTGRNLRIG